MTTLTFPRCTTLNHGCKCFGFYKQNARKCSYTIEGDLLSVQNGVDFHKASVLVDTKYAFRGLVNTRS